MRIVCNGHEAWGPPLVAFAAQVGGGCDVRMSVELGSCHVRTLPYDLLGWVSLGGDWRIECQWFVWVRYPQYKRGAEAQVGWKEKTRGSTRALPSPLFDWKFVPIVQLTCSSLASSFHGPVLFILENRYKEKNSQANVPINWSSPNNTQLFQHRFIQTHDLQHRQKLLPHQYWIWGSTGCGEADTTSTLLVFLTKSWQRVSYELRPHHQTRHIANTKHSIACFPSYRALRLLFIGRRGTQGQDLFFL